MTIKNPKTNLKDYQEFIHERSMLEVSIVRGDINIEQFDNALINLKDKYKDKIFHEDIYFFDDLASYKSFLEENLGPNHSEKILRHELSHSDKALKKDLLIKYGIVFFEASSPSALFDYLPFIRVSGNFTSEDLKEICLSPEDPSFDDHEKCKILEQKLK
ncbi:MAG: hypothetical protein ACP5OG_04165 [Candidatus Nanoarchaeia archaeon]